MADKKYKMSFSTGGLFIQESIVIVDQFDHIKDWAEVRSKVDTDNLLQARTISAAKRTSREASLRLKCLSYDELDYFSTAPVEDQAYMLWLANCRYYKFIAEFAVEVLHERFVTLKGDINYIDFDAFFDHKAEWDSTLEEIKPTTRKKLRQVLFRMMREANLLGPDYDIRPALFSPHLIKIIAQGNSEEFSYFPIYENDIKKMTA